MQSMLMINEKRSVISRNIKLFFLLWAAILSNACEYEPNEVYERQVNKDIVAPGVQNVSLDLSTDTISIYSNMEVNFSFSTTKQKILEVRFTVDSGYYTSANTADGTYNFNYTGLTEGYHTLRADIYTESGTNSIADRIGAEGYVFSKYWTLKVYKNYSATIEACSKNGYLKLSWTKYLASDFKQYVIYKRHQSWHNYEEVRKTADAEFIDSSYVGEPQEYRIDVMTKKGDVIKWGERELYTDFYSLNLRVEVTDDHQYILKWNKSPYYNAIESIRITQDLMFDQIKEIKNTANLDDTSCLLSDVYFGQLVQFFVTMVPKTKNPKINYQHWTILAIGHLYKNAGTYFIKRVNQDEFIYGTSDMVKYSISQKKITEKIDLPPFDNSILHETLNISSTGKYIICNYDKMKDLNTDIFYASSASLKNYLRLAPMVPRNYDDDIKVSDEGIWALQSFRSIYVYNYNNSTILGEYKKDNQVASCLDISPSGEYLIIKDDSVRLVRFTNSKFIEIGSQQLNSTIFCEFNKVDQSKMVIWDGNTFSVKQCNNFNTLYSFSLNDNYIINIDYDNNEILTFNNAEYPKYRLYIRSLLNGSILNDIPINRHNGAYQYNYGEFLLINHTIVAKTGVFYFVNNK